MSMDRAPIPTTAGEEDGDPAEPGPRSRMSFEIGHSRGAVKRAPRELP